MKRVTFILGIFLIALLLGACPGEGVTTPGLEETESSSASVTEVTMSAKVDSYSRPVEQKAVFTEDVSEIYCCALVSDAPDATSVTSEWTYSGGAEGMAAYNLEEKSQTVSGTKYIYFKQVRSSSAWPVGSYEVKLYLNGEEAAGISFDVKAAVAEKEIQKLLVLNIKGWQSGAYYYVSGTVKNIGNVPLTDIRLQATFFDEDNKVIKTAEGYLEPRTIGVWETAHAQTEKVTSTELKYYTYCFVLPSGEVLDVELE